MTVVTTNNAPEEGRMNEDQKARQREAYERFLAACDAQDARDERIDREHAKRVATQVLRIVHGRTMKHLAAARDSVAAQIELLAEKLRTALGEDYGITGDEVKFGFVADLATGMQLVAIRLGERVFTHGSGDGVIVYREDGDDLEFAQLGDDGEAVDPWRKAPEGWELGPLG